MIPTLLLPLTGVAQLFAENLWKAFLWQWGIGYMRGILDEPRQSS
jgi:hypothetical protein